MIAPHEAALLNTDRIWRPGREPGSGISPREYAAAIWALLDLDGDAFDEAMSFDNQAVAR